MSITAIDRILCNGHILVLQEFPTLTNFTTYIWINNQNVPTMLGAFSLHNFGVEAGDNVGYTKKYKINNSETDYIEMQLASVDGSYWYVNVTCSHNGSTCLSIGSTPIAKYNSSSIYPQYVTLAIGLDSSDNRYKPIELHINYTGSAWSGWIVGAPTSGWASYNAANFDAMIRAGAITQDPYQTAPDSEPDGGYGDFDYSGDSITPPDLPTISVANSGFVTLFAPDTTQLQSLASYMWSSLFDLSNFRKLFADPMDCIISLNILPCDLPTGAAQELKVGNIGTGQNINVLSAQFIKIAFATKNIGVRTNSFMDYSPYVKAQLFLPFIGARSLSIDEIANADIDIEYHIDLFSGACAAYVTITKLNSDGSVFNSTIYQFNGNVCANIPFTATNYSGFLSSLLGTAAAVTTAIATQGSSSAVAGALSSGIDTATAIKPDVERSGNMSATNGFLGIQKPYLIITYPHVCKPTSRDKTVGTPSFVGLSDNKHLSAFHGYTKLHKINVKGIPCTEQERGMIESLLLGEGVILP